MTPSAIPQLGLSALRHDQPGTPYKTQSKVDLHSDQCLPMKSVIR
jgi:hypothetical protein